MFNQGFQTRENNENRGTLPPRFLLSSSVWSLLMKHDKQEFELPSQTTIGIDLLHVCFIDLNM